MAQDAFLKDLESAGRVRDQIQADFAEREKAVGRGESTGRLDARLRGALQQLAIDVDSLVRTVDAYRADISRYRISERDFTRRQTLVKGLEEDLRRFDSQLRGIASKGSSPKTSARSGRNKESGGLEEAKGTREVGMMMDSEFKRQEDVVDEILGTTENLKVAAKGIGDEVETHLVLLDLADRNVDIKQLKLTRANMRMNLLMKRSADGMMICCIILLITSLVLIILLL